MEFNKENMMIIGARISEERKRQKLSQGSLAAMLGYTSHSYISNVENGKKPPSLKMLCNLSEIFEVDMDYFWSEF